MAKKHHLLLILTTIVGFQCYSQISFEKGYFINNAGQKIDGLIKNLDWKNNPTEFTYKSKETMSEEIKSIRTVKEFGIYEESKYSRFTINIDRSSKSLGLLSDHRNPVFRKEKLFLKALVEGKANLFCYEEGSLKRFFYSIDDSDVEQLVYKNYKTPENKIGENNKYKQQLWQVLSCRNISMIDIKLLNYSENELIKMFVKFNECTKSNYTLYKKQKKNIFNLTLRPGYNISALTIDNTVDNNRDVNFGTKLGFRFGLEAEFVMPFNKNKWSLIIEPTYQIYVSEKELERQNVKADYKSIELPIGIRHNMFLSERSKLFLDGAVVFDLSTNSMIEYERTSNLEIKSSPNLAFGIGYKFDDRYGLQIRYYTRRNIVGGYQTYYSRYKTISFIFGITIL